DGEEVALAAAVRLAVALDEPRALGDLVGELAVAPGCLGHHAEPALDERLLLHIAIAHRAQRLEPGEGAHEQVAEESRGLDVHADVIGVELAAPLGPGDEAFSKEVRHHGSELLDAGLE